MRVRRWARATVVAVLAAGGVLVTAQAALASWGQQTAPIPGTISDLGALSCPASADNFCAAVGSYTDTAGTHILSEFRSGYTWSVGSVPGPSGAVLNDVSCATTTACVAVGDQPNGSGTATFAAIWNGSSWSDRAIPNPSGANVTLNNVACSSATKCMAVGSTGTATLAETWNGTTWSLQSIPNGGGTTSNALNGISCTSATSCMAVGAAESGATTTSLAERWNGTSWAIKPTPNPTGTYNPLNDVSCPLPTACTAVGPLFAEHWNGTSWALLKIAGTGGDTGATLTGISCISATDCSAVGSYYDSEAISQAIAEVWTGGAWHVQTPVISTAYDSSGLSDIKCHTATECTAAGFYHDPNTGNKALVEVYMPRWSYQEIFSPSGAISASATQVACVSGSFCEAVGGAEDSDGTFPAFAAQWNGSSWVTQTTPNAANTALSGVSCVSASDCMAVGDQVGSGGAINSLVEWWDGTAWNTLSSPNPSGATHTYLLSVACTSSTSCLATGFWQDGSGNQHTLAERWNGSWSISPPQNPGSGTTPELDSISCASATSCIAVGSYLTPSYTLLAESWNGSTWTTLQTTNPVGSTSGNFSGVSCRSATMCMAVGSYNNGSGDVPLTDTWNGSSWTPGTGAIPAGSSTSQFAGISCAGTTSCIATGSKTTASGTFAMAESWGGTSWSAQPLGSPGPSVSSSALAGVSCVSATHCMAVGWYTSGTQAALSELYN